MNGELSVVNVTIRLVIEIERILVVGGIENVPDGNTPVVEDAVGACEFPEVARATCNVTAGWVSGNETSDDKVTIDEGITPDLGGVVIDVGFSF